MTDIAVVFPSLIVMRSSVAAVWLYEGLWCKILGGLPSQDDRRDGCAAVLVRVSAFRSSRCSVSWRWRSRLWVMSGRAPGLCALVQTALLIVLNVNGLLWARRIIHDPAGMVVKNVAFLVLVWVCGAAS